MIRRNLPRSFDELAGLRARGLVRESTVEQGDHSGPIVQRADVETFAARYRLLLEERRDPTSGDVGPYLYTDLVSGSDAAKRPEFLQMIADAKAGAFDVLLVRETSRFARNWRQAGGYEDQLHAAGVVIAYIYEGRLSSERAGQLQLVVNHAINEEYREKLIENVRRGYRVRRFEAGRFSGSPPLGYLMEYEDVWSEAKRGTERRETGHLVPDEELRIRPGGATYSNAGLIRHLGQLYASGRFGARSLAAHLNGEGYLTARGAPFTGNAIRHMMESPTYAGILSWHHRADKRLRGEVLEEVAASWDPLWPAELWEQIQAVRRRQWRGSNGGKIRNVYPLRRLAVCDRCGSRLYGEARDGVTYMACVTQRERHACVQRGIRTSVLEDQVGAWLATVKIPATWRADMERLQAELTGPPKARVDDQARIVGQITRLQELYELGHIAGGREEYISRRRVLETELTGAPVTSLAPVSVLEQAKRLLDDLADLWARANVQERSDICQTMFAEVRVRDQAIVGAELARPEYLPLIASSEASARLAVSVAPPDGSADARPTNVLAIAGLEELVERLLAAA